MTNRIGYPLGNYRLVRLLGHGGFAEVYLGEHVYLKSHAAIKVLRMVLKDEDAEGFLKEAQTLVHLNHPHIVRVLDFAVADDTPFLVMEYAPGGTLRQRHPKGTRLSPETLVPYVQQVASALQYAHEQRLVHRDVKPENMLLGARDQVLLSDFGLAMLAPHTHPYSAHNVAQQVAGTSPYLAPEQLQGRPQSASDQYALGVVVYEWLCGRPPFSGTPIEVAAQHLSMSPPPLREQVPDLLPATEDVVLRALAKDSKDRFARVQEFAEALQRACQSSPAQFAPSVPTTGSAESQSPVRPEPIWKVPTTFTPLIGREQDVAMIGTLLKHPEVRLLTLLGTGGIGKTRLALQVAAEMRDSFADGVCFVPLASVSDPTLVIPTIAQDLDIQEIGKQSLFEQVKLALLEKHLLLVLDNFEQVVGAASLVEDLLAACPSLKIVVTSRAVLHLQAEHEFPVGPLALPPLSQLPENKALSQYAAVALFVQRAQAVLPSFQLTQANARAIAEICVRLDGLPLAIELAAARVKLLPPQALLARLTQGLRVLVGGARALPVRQQTLRNTLKWSYDLLDVEEQQLFRLLAVFVGGCSLEAAEALSHDIGNETTDVLNTIASLIDESLVQQTEREGDEPRLIMLEIVREYGLECLRERGEAEAVQRGHALYYLRLSEEAEPHLKGAQQVVWLERLEREHDNLRAVMRWSLEQGETRRNMEMALRLGGALGRFWQVRGHWSEGWTFLEQALGRSDGIVASIRGKALTAAVSLAYVQRDYDRAEALTQELLALYRELRDTQGIARSLHRLGAIAAEKYNLTAALSLAEESLPSFRELGDKESIAYSLLLLAYIARVQGAYTRAYALYEESLAMHRQMGNTKGIATSLFNLADVLFLSQGDPATLHSLLEEALALYRELGDKEYIAYCLSLSGEVALSRGDATTARSLFEESMVLSTEIGSQWQIADWLSLLASVATVQGDYTTAHALYKKGLTLAMEVGDKQTIAYSLEGLGEMAAEQGEPTWAVRLLGAAEALRDIIGVPLPPVYCTVYERAVATARAHLGEKAFASVWAEGRTMTPEQALTPPKQAIVPEPVPTAPKPAPLPTHPDDLTAREVEVLRLLAQGWTDAQIAEQLVISPRTANAHVASIYRKIQVSSRSAATRYAIEKQLV